MGYLLHSHCYLCLLLFSFKALLDCKSCSLSCDHDHSSEVLKFAIGTFFIHENMDRHCSWKVIDHYLMQFDIRQNVCPDSATKVSRRCKVHRQFIACPVVPSENTRNFCFLLLFLSNPAINLLTSVFIFCTCSSLLSVDLKLFMHDPFYRCIQKILAGRALSRMPVLTSSLSLDLKVLLRK